MTSDARATSLSGITDPLRRAGHHLFVGWVGSGGRQFCELSAPDPYITGV